MLPIQLPIYFRENGHYSTFVRGTFVHLHIRENGII